MNAARVDRRPFARLVVAVVCPQLNDRAKPARGRSVTRGDQVQKPKNLYTGKTYNNADAIAEFFKKRGSAISQKAEKPASEPETPRRPAGYKKLRSIASDNVRVPQTELDDARPILAGTHVKHEKYGKGLVLRQRGSGDNVKLTISFPGFGQKKLIEKYANLEKA